MPPVTLAQLALSIAVAGLTGVNWQPLGPQLFVPDFMNCAATSSQYISMFWKTPGEELNPAEILTFLIAARVVDCFTYLLKRPPARASV